MSEMIIFLDFFVMWSNKVVSFLRSALSWLKGPIQCNISSTTTSSHPILIAHFLFQTMGFVSVLLVKSHGSQLRTLAIHPLAQQVGSWNEGKLQHPGETSQASCLILIYLYKDTLCFLHSKACHVFQSAPGAGCLLQNERDRPNSFVKGPLQLIFCRPLKHSLRKHGKQSLSGKCGL